jgi:hypothetical protein
MSEKRDLFRAITGISYQDWTRKVRLPKADESIDRIYKQGRSSYPLRSLGTGVDGEVLISEEERESHMHIIGTTGEGKSKFLEYLMRGDIRRGLGFCFMDASDRGDTLYKILAYLAKVNHKKVLLIDPHHHRLYQRICPINPFIIDRNATAQSGSVRYKYKEASVANVLDTFRVLYQQKDWSETPIIRRYLKAVISILWNAGLSISDAVYFTEPMYKSQRERILATTDPDDRQRLMLDYVFFNKQMFAEYQSTVRRLEEVFHPTLQLIFGSREGLDFPKLIAEGWVILVNLYAGFGFEAIHTRLLGTAIINEMISAIDRLRSPRINKDGTKRKGWNGVYYLYIDEAGRYANRNLADLLAYKRKSGLRVTIAHQYAGQFEDPYILEAVGELCKIKVAFFQPNPKGRMDTVKTMYGGELRDRDVSYALSNMRKQHAVIKLPKKPAVIARIKDVKSAFGSEAIEQRAIDKFTERIYRQDFYQDSNEIIHDQKQRLYEIHLSAEHADPSPPRKRAKPNKSATGHSASSRPPRPKSPLDE